MKHKRKLPEDGCLKPLSSNGSISCNIMIIRVPDEMKGPGEMTYQLATLDRNKEGIEHTGDKYVDKLIPNLPKVNAPIENRSELKNTTGTTNTYFRRRRIIPLGKKTDTHLEEKIPNLPKLNAPVENRSELKNTTDTTNTYFRRRRISPLGQKTDAHHENKFQSYKYNTRGIQNPPKDINPWIQNPWENQSNCFYSGMNPTRLNNSSVSNSYDPVMCRSMRNQYGSFNNNSYKNNYNKNPRSRRVPNNLYVNRQANRNKINGPLNSNTPEAFDSSSNNNSFVADPPPYNSLSCDTLTSTTSYNDNSVRYQRENVTSNPMFKKTFPRKNQNFRETNPHESNFNRNSRFRYKNNEYGNDNREEISNHDISNDSYENQKETSEIYDKYQKFSKVTTCEDMSARTSENRSDESLAATSGFVSPSTNEEFEMKTSGNFSNTSKFTASRNTTPVRFKYNHAFFRNSRAYRRNFSSGKSFNQGNQMQNTFPRRYNNRGRYIRRRGNFMN